MTSHSSGSSSLSASSPSPGSSPPQSSSGAEPGVRGALLVGSVPLSDTEAVLRAAAGALGGHLRRIPDGETGERSWWIRWQQTVFAGHPDFEPDPLAAPPSAASDVPMMPRFRVRDGIDPNAVVLGPLGYADAAIGSYQVFDRLSRDGVIRGRSRFQVCVPTPLNAIRGFVTPTQVPALEPVYEAALLRELDAICAAVPPDRLAVQFDAPAEVRTWTGRVPPGPIQETPEAALERMLRLAAAVPTPVELGYHLCYGDYAHLPAAVRNRNPLFGPPPDATAVTGLGNALGAHTRRRVDYIHLPVPRQDSDSLGAYLAPLAELALPEQTELYLGLAHHTDGEPGTHERIEAARAVVPRGFGVATECGWGRRDPHQVPDLLTLHARLADPWP